MVKRLKEFHDHHNWCAPQGLFPAPFTRSRRLTKAVIKFRSTPASNVFDPRRRARRETQNWKPWLKLVYCEAPRAKPSALRLKWLSYLYQQPLPTDALKRFPPLNSALMTMTSEPDWDEAAAIELFGCFTRCDVEVLDNGGSDGGVAQDSVRFEAHPVRGVNGLTVVFLAHFLRHLTPVSYTLLGTWKAGMVIVRDILNSPGAHVLMEDRSEDTSDNGLVIPEVCRHRGWLMKGALVDLLSLASENHVPFTLESLCERVSQLMQAWACRRRIQQLLDVKPLPLLDILKEVLMMYRAPLTTRPRPEGLAYSFMLRGSGAFEVKEGPQQLSCMALFYGCAVGTVATMAMERIDRRERNCVRVKDSVNVAAELAANMTNAITTVLLPGGISFATEQTKDVFSRFLERKLARANSSDVQGLRSMLQHVRSSMLTLLNAYDQVVDRDHFFRRFSQSFILTLARGDESYNPQEVLDWFKRTELTDDLITIVPSERVCLDPRFGDMFFYDMSLINLINSPRHYLEGFMTQDEYNMDLVMRVRRWLGSIATPLLIIEDQPRRPTTQAVDYRRLIESPPATASPPTLLQRTSFASSMQMGWTALALFVVLWLLQFTLSRVEQPQAPAPQAVARVLQDFQASSSVHLFREDIVFIIDSPLEGWLRFEDPTGRSGVRDEVGRWLTKDYTCSSRRDTRGCSHSTNSRDYPELTVSMPRGSDAGPTTPHPTLPPPLPSCSHINLVSLQRAVHSV